MINVDYISPSLYLGIAVAMSGLILYTLKLQNARGTKDLDIVTASLLVVSGVIVTVQGWRLDPILMLSEGLLASVGVYYIAQTVELRKQLVSD
jgi:Ycf66 protein N-terminus